MSAVAFMLCVAGGFFVEPAAARFLRRVWVNGILAWWIARKTRPVSIAPADPMKLLELRDGIAKAVDRLTDDVVRYDDLIAAELEANTPSSHALSHLLERRVAIAHKLEQYRATLRDVETTIKQSQRIQEDLDHVDDAMQVGGRRNVHWRISVHHADDTYRCYRFDNGAPHLIGTTNFRTEAEYLVSRDRLRVVLGDPLAYETEPTAVLAAF